VTNPHKSTADEGRDGLPELGAMEALRSAALDQTRFGESAGRAITPHRYYRYPARFTPRFAAAAIHAVAEPGALVLDPFVGGGTTLIEAMRHGRYGLGVDISPISAFVSTATSSLYTPRELEIAVDWLTRRLEEITTSELGIPLSETFPKIHLDAQRNWRILKTIDRLVCTLGDLPRRSRMVARLVVLRSSQWAFDHRQRVPTHGEFRTHVMVTMADAASVLSAFRAEIREEWGPRYRGSYHEVLCGDASDVMAKWRINSRRLADAIVTSPPYPGVHMLYGRWQVNGRRETSLPMWIVESSDLLREGDFTMHARREPHAETYFRRFEQTMVEVRGCVRDDAWAVHMVGFSNPAVYLPRYLRAMRNSGFREVRSRELGTHADGRLWRDVPGRRWYAKRNGTLVATRREVVLLFKAV
jgi:hypothetical protein